MLGTNIGEVITVFVAMLLWQVTPLLSMQLLWINLVTDSLPAIALGMEPVEDEDELNMVEEVLGAFMDEMEDYGKED